MTTLDPRAVKAALDAYGIDAVVDGLEAAIAAYLAATQPQAGEPVAAHGYATRLLTSLMEKHYPDRSPEWAPLPDLYGVLTQIDNLSTGLVRASPQPANPAQAVSGLVADLEQAVIDFENARSDTYNRAKKELQRARAALIAAIGAGGQAVGNATALAEQAARIAELEVERDEARKLAFANADSAAEYSERFAASRAACEGLRAERDEANRILASVRKVRDGYASQAKFADIDCAVHFREFVSRLDRAALSQKDETHA